MQGWFLRCSWLEQFQFLTKMLYSLSSISSLSIVLNSLLTCSGKASIYSIENNSNFIYDKGSKDNNRALHHQTLKEIQDEDLQWFNTLQDDSEQVLIFIGMLRLGGGLIMYEIYKKGVKLFEKLTSQAGVKLSKTTDNTPPSRPSQIPPPNMQKRFNIVPDYIFPIDPTDPVVVETAVRKKEWHDAVNKYRMQVETRTKDTIKLEKKKKPPKAKKKGGASKGDSSNELDFLQLIPITLVKRIFNYLDAGTLKKIKNVNKYWDYAVKDLLKEQKGRKNLDKFIKKMEKNMTDEDNEEDLEEGQEKLATAYDKTYPKKRVKKLLQRGSVLPKLIHPVREPFVNESWISKSDDLKEYLLQLQNLKLFPRSYCGSLCLRNHVLGATLKKRYAVFQHLHVDDAEIEKMNEYANCGGTPNVRTSNASSDS